MEIVYLCYVFFVQAVYGEYMYGNQVVCDGCIIIIHVREYVGKLMQMKCDYRLIHIPYVYYVCNS